MSGDKFKVMLGVLPVLFASVAWAPGDIYVKMNGGHDDTGDGSSGDPFQTIHKALQVASNGDIIKVKGGVGSTWDYSIDNGEQFPLALAPGVSIIGDEVSRPSWPRLGGDAAGIAQAIISVDATSGDNIAGTVSKLFIRGEDVANEDAPIALMVVATNGNVAGITFQNNTCGRPHLNDSTSGDLATISILAMDGQVNSTSIVGNSIECSDRGGVEMISVAGTGEDGATAVTIEDNALFTKDEDTSQFGIRWQGVDMDAEAPDHNGPLSINRNVIRPLEDGAIVGGIEILCEEHTSWGSNSMEENTVDGCSGNGITFSSDGWESASDAEITVFFSRNRVINNGGSGIRVEWDPTNHESDLGYGYVHFVAEGCVIAGNGDYGVDLVGLGENSAVETASQVFLTNCTIADNDAGAMGFSNLTLGSSDPAAELAEVEFAFLNLVVYGNNDELEAEVDGLTGDLLDVIYAAAWNSDWQGHPLAALANDPCVPEVGSQYVIDCDPDFVNAASRDLHIEGTSPCLDAGNNDYVNLLFDLDRDNRKQDGDCAGGDVVDMGYDEVPEDC